MRAVSFEVVVCVTCSVAGVTANRWFIESLHETLRDARERYQRVSDAWPDRRLVVALVQSEFDERTRLFRDVVLDARDRTVLFTRRQATPLSREARSAIQAAFGQPRAPVETALAGPATFAPAGLREAPAMPLALAIGGGLACVALAIALR